MGVVVSGRKLIYVNGICVKPPSYWTLKQEDVCDGVACFWGVLYDPATREFSPFEMNGVAEDVAKEAKQLNLPGW